MGKIQRCHRVKNILAGFRNTEAGAHLSGALHIRGELQYRYYEIAVNA